MLAWKLCGKWLDVRGVVVHGSSVGLGVYRREEVEETINHYCRMLLTRHYDQRPFDEPMCDAIIANGGVKKLPKKVQNVCDDGCIKHGLDFSCVCDTFLVYL